jgi:WD40 repeat protein
VLSVAVSGDHGLIVTGSGDGTARVWHAAAAANPLRLEGHTGTIADARFSRDGARIVTASADGTARIWTVRPTPPVILRHNSPVLTAAFDPDGTRVVTSAADGVVRIWKTDGEAPPAVLRRDKTPLRKPLFSPDGRRLVALAGADALVWPAHGQGDPVALRGHRGEIDDAVFSPDGRRLATSAKDGTVRLWALDGRTEPVVVAGVGGEVSDVRFSPNGEWILTSGFGHTGVRLWRSDGAGKPRLLKAEFSPDSGAFSPDGRWVATGSSSGAVRLWPVADGEPVDLLPGTEMEPPGSTARFSPDGRWLATIRGKDLQIRPTDQPTSYTTLREAGFWFPTDVAFSPDSRFLLAAYDKDLARLWPVGSGGQALALAGYRSSMKHLAFSPTGRAIAATAEDFSVRVWLLDWDALLERLASRTTACLTAAQRRLLLGEEAADARDRYAACEGAYGRGAG